MKNLYSLKKYFIVIIVLIASCAESNNELFKVTDNFVTALDEKYESYGLLGGRDHKILTSDGLYSISPVGRLINVKIQKAVSDKEYEELRLELKNHFIEDKRVNKVYICGAGTIMIDCRK
jgi:hypothetical protein